MLFINDIIQFQLNSKDVFITKNDIVYFMINFSLKDDRQDMIKVGQIFLHKYKFVPIPHVAVMPVSFKTF